MSLHAAASDPTLDLVDFILALPQLPRLAPPPTPRECAAWIRRTQGGAVFELHGPLTRMQQLLVYHDLQN